MSLTPLAYQWCSAISENTRKFERGGIAPLRLLYTALAVAFRQIGPDHLSDTRLTHTRHHELMFDNAFASEDDDVIADVVSAWIVDPLITPFGSCTQRLVKFVGRDRPLSQRLRRVIVHSVQRHWPGELNAAGSEFVVLLNHLEVNVEDMDDTVGKLYWVSLLAGVLGSQEGQDRLSCHYWRLLGNLISMGARLPQRVPGSDMDITKSLEDTEEWEKLEMWLLTMWGSWYTRDAIPMQDVERTTLKLFSQRPTALPKFEDLHAQTPATYASLFRLYGDQFKRICDDTRAGRPSLESTP